MKTLADGTQVTSRSYYYLLEWNEKDDWIFLAQSIGKNRLCDVNRIEYKKLFAKAIGEDLKSM